ncbi:hypothetical protein LZ575_20380 [Antarcticibacterium sp. 1MA-6-2]|uniref:ABC transporter permease n=1 Tax=Antarcticibacterium sp. 1MA-6-2 TaxID=2908210 RepID=UPI001F3A165B|nr:ABC transporter permease [Antarcticibacterium sp. 1MA-6-2]UJH91003.1 hypothetical protein LZ575_20380 [Antarcticibacterium sp. 1MA-6-2]
MIKSYITSAVRNLMKFRFISLINIFGLTIGLCCCLLISAFVLHELSYDRYHENASNIYRIERTFINPETGIPSLELGSAAPAIGPLLENDFKEIEKLTRVVSAGIVTLQHKDNIFNENDTYFADENFVQMFNINFIKGNPEHALTENLKTRFPAFFNSGLEASGWISLNLRPLNEIPSYSHTDLEAEVNGNTSYPIKT